MQLENNSLDKIKAKSLRNEALSISKGLLANTLHISDRYIRDFLLELGSYFDEAIFHENHPTLSAHDDIDWHSVLDMSIEDFFGSQVTEYIRHLTDYIDDPRVEYDGELMALIEIGRFLEHKFQEVSRFEFTQADLYLIFSNIDTYDANNIWSELYIQGIDGFTISSTSKGAHMYVFEKNADQELGKPKVQEVQPVAETVPEEKPLEHYESIVRNNFLKFVDGYFNELNFNWTQLDMMPSGSDYLTLYHSLLGIIKNNEEEYIKIFAIVLSSRDLIEDTREISGEPGDEFVGLLHRFRGTDGSERFDSDQLAYYQKLWNPIGGSDVSTRVSDRSVELHKRLIEITTPESWNKNNPEGFVSDIEKAIVQLQQKLGLDRKDYFTLLSLRELYGARLLDDDEFSYSGYSSQGGRQLRQSMADFYQIDDQIWKEAGDLANPKIAIKDLGPDGMQTEDWKKVLMTDGLLPKFETISYDRVHIPRELIPLHLNIAYGAKTRQVLEGKYATDLGMLNQQRNFAHDLFFVKEGDNYVLYAKVIINGQEKFIKVPPIPYEVEDTVYDYELEYLLLDEKSQPLKRYTGDTKKLNLYKTFTDQMGMLLSGEEEIVPGEYKLNIELLDYLKKSNPKLLALITVLVAIISKDKNLLDSKFDSQNILGLLKSGKVNDIILAIKDNQQGTVDGLYAIVDALLNHDNKDALVLNAKMNAMLAYEPIREVYDMLFTSTTRDIRDVIDNGWIEGREREDLLQIMKDRNPGTPIDLGDLIARYNDLYKDGTFFEYFYEYGLPKFDALVSIKNSNEYGISSPYDFSISPLFWQEAFDPSLTQQDVTTFFENSASKVQGKEVTIHEYLLGDILNQGGVTRSSWDLMYQRSVKGYTTKEILKEYGRFHSPIVVKLQALKEYEGLPELFELFLSFRIVVKIDDAYVLTPLLKDQGYTFDTIFEIPVVGLKMPQIKNTTGEEEGVRSEDNEFELAGVVHPPHAAHTAEGGGTPGSGLRGNDDADDSGNEGTNERGSGARTNNNEKVVAELTRIQDQLLEVGMGKIQAAGSNSEILLEIDRIKRQAIADGYPEGLEPKGTQWIKRKVKELFGAMTGMQDDSRIDMVGENATISRLSTSKETNAGMNALGILDTSLEVRPDSHEVVLRSHVEIDGNNEVVLFRMGQSDISGRYDEFNDFVRLILSDTTGQKVNLSSAQRQYLALVAIIDRTKLLCEKDGSLSMMTSKGVQIRMRVVKGNLHIERETGSGRSTVFESENLLDTLFSDAGTDQQRNAVITSLLSWTSDAFINEENTQKRFLRKIDNHELVYDSGKVAKTAKTKLGKLLGTGKRNYPATLEDATITVTKKERNFKNGFGILGGNDITQEKKIKRIQLAGFGPETFTFDVQERQGKNTINRRYIVAKTENGAPKIYVASQNQSSGLNPGQYDLEMGMFGPITYDSVSDIVKKVSNPYDVTNAYFEGILDQMAQSSSVLGPNDSLVLNDDNGSAFVVRFEEVGGRRKPVIYETRAKDQQELDDMLLEPDAVEVTLWVDGSSMQTRRVRKISLGQGSQRTDEYDANSIPLEKTGTPHTGSLTTMYTLINGLSQISQN